ncbi:MAG: hypothetical protein Q9225_003229, partial [Loekoesia sp. 1 TL-2023]
SIDLNPSVPASASAEPTAAATAVEASKPTGANAAPAAVNTSATATGPSTAAGGKKGVNEGGMSATSGPLDDQLAHGYADENVVNKEVEEEGLEKKEAVAA